ncbi:MAG: DUF799 family lipoprotein, partial [Elusimicrobia bacterium]|nr:DUF799 family lipoprotein [Elusimicrobiota bacterium]
SEVEKDLRARGWAVDDPARVDAALKDLGVTDGGQLPSVDSRKLGQAVGAPGLMFGTIEEFADMNVGFARRRAVRVSLRLIDAATGQRLWEAVGQDQTEIVTLDRRAAERALMVGLAQKALENATGKPLAAETRAAVAKALSYLSGR